MSGNFGSLLSEITGSSQPTSASHSKLAARPRNDDTTANPAARPVSLKRKPEGEDVGPPPKVARPDLQRANSASRPNSSSGLAPKAAALSLNQNAPGSNAKAGVSTSKANPQNVSTPAASAKAPPKGSYRDLIAKARENQQVKQTPQSQTPQASLAASQVKQADKRLGRRAAERMEARQRARQAVKEGKDPKAYAGTAKSASKSSTATSRASGKTKEASKPILEVKKPKKVRPPIEYKGTMRGNAAPPKKPILDRSTASDGKKKAAGYSSASGSEMDGPQIGKRYKYAGSSDEDEDEDDYDSEGSEDMEGGGFDALEAEEEMSLRAARKEDAEALKQEEAHRQEKLERKKKLQALASKAKPTKY